MSRPAVSRRWPWGPVGVARAAVLGLALLLVTSLGVAARLPALERAELSAEIDFGSEIEFSLAVPWTEAEPRAVEVRFGLPESVVTNRAEADFAIRQGVLEATHRWRLRGTVVPGADIRYEFAIVTADGERALTAPALVTYVDLALPWTQAREGPVEIWYYAGGEGLESDARAGIRSALTLLQEDFGVEPTRATRLVLYADILRMREALGGGTSPWVGGAALADFGVIVLHAAADRAYRQDLAAVIAHELTHIVIEHATENPFGRVPAWLHEGLATVVESSVFERFPYDEIVADAVARNEFVSLRGITGTFPANNRRAIQAYAQSHSLVQHIIDRWGAGSIKQLLDAYAGGVTDGEAVTAALGVTLAELEEGWLASLGVENPSFAALAGTEAPTGAPPAEATGPTLPGPEQVGAVIASAAVVSAVVTVLVLFGRQRARSGDRRP